MKRSEHLQPLSHDHYHGLLTARRIREMLDEGVAPEDVAVFASRFWTEHLQRHFEEEEDFILPALYEVGAEELAERTLDEHRSIREQVRSLSAKDASHAALSQLADDLQVHARFEEREVFPALEQKASEEALHAIGEHLRREEDKPHWDPSTWEPPS